MNKVFLVIVSVLLLATAACAPDPVQLAKASAMNTDTYIKEANAELDLEIRKANAQAQIDAQRAQIENDRLKAEAESAAIQETARLKAVAEQDAIKAKGQAWAGTLQALGFGGKIALVVLSAGLALALVVAVAGRSAAYAINSVLDAQYVRIGVEPSTLLPPPFVITMDGWLIDTRSGERAAIRDAVGVNRLRLAATTQATNTALLGRAAVEISKTNRGKGGDGVRAAESLPTIAASIPMLDTGEDE